MLRRTRQPVGSACNAGPATTAAVQRLAACLMQSDGTLTKHSAPGRLKRKNPQPRRLSRRLMLCRRFRLRGYLTLCLALTGLLASTHAWSDQLRIQGVLFRDGDSIVRLLESLGPPLLISTIGTDCIDRYCRYRTVAERWTYIDDGKEIRITVVDDTVEAIDWKFEGHRW